jgi:hypothetical protein
LAAGSRLFRREHTTCCGSGSLDALSVYLSLPMFPRRVLSCVPPEVARSLLGRLHVRDRGAPTFFAIEFAPADRRLRLAEALLSIATEDSTYVAALKAGALQAMAMDYRSGIRPIIRTPN